MLFRLFSATALIIPQLLHRTLDLVSHPPLTYFGAKAVGHIHIGIGPLALHLHAGTLDELAQLSVGMFSESISISSRLAIMEATMNYLNYPTTPNCLQLNFPLSDFQKFPWPLT